MQIGAANLLALQQAQGKTQKQETGDFASVLAAGPEQDFAPLFSEDGKAQEPAQAGPGPALPSPEKPTAPAAFQPPGSQLDIKI